MLTIGDSVIVLNWLPPFTLNIDGIERDIEGYRVEVFNSSSYSLIHSVFVMTNETEYPTPPDGACHIYMFTVTPENINGGGAKNTVSYFGAETRTLSKLAVHMHACSLFIMAALCTFLLL